MGPKEGNAGTEIVLVPIEEELKRSYLDYAMSVIVSRALPDVRDGMKPVHRRILYAMAEEGFDYDKPHRKSARIAGQVISKYHPHGTDPVYEAMVRMAQPFSMRVPLVDGQGNFGSMDGDKPAAMRYTEARLSRAAHFLIEDYDKDTVSFVPNYDDTLMMPTVLPARFPNLLVNGASGIAVGMATNIPTHNLGEVIDACCALVDQPDMDLPALMQYIKGPDFSTGGIVMGIEGIYQAYRTGHGSFSIRAVSHIEEIKKDREAIVVTEIPYQVNKARLVEHIAELVNAKTLDGISDLRDESDRDGVRIVIELKRDANPDVVLSQLYTSTSLQISFGVNLITLDGGKPVQMGVLEVLHAFLKFRREVVTRRTQFYLRKAQGQAHIVLGLVVAVSHIDEVVQLIKSSKDPQEALRQLIDRTWHLGDSVFAYLKVLGEGVEGSKYQLSEEQARAILALRLQRLTGMESQKLLDDLTGLLKEIEGYRALLGSDEKISRLMKEEFEEVKRLLATPRKSQLVAAAAGSCTIEDLIPREQMVVTVSIRGYIKRVPLDAYRSQKRGGRGKSAMATREEDEVSQVFVVDTHTLLLFFSSMGKAYQLKVHELPLESTASRGKPLVTLFPFVAGETLSTLLPLPSDEEVLKSLEIVFATASGNVRKNALTDFLDIRANGKIAIKLDEGDKLVSVALVSADQDVLLSSRHGKSIRFSVEDLRQFSGRTSSGVRGMRLIGGDLVVSMCVLSSCSYSSEERESYMSAREGEGALSENVRLKMASGEQFLLSVSERGFGKRTSSYAYRSSGRGGQGVAAMEVTPRTGTVVNVLPVEEKDHVFLLTNRGQLLRCPIAGIRIAGRKTQGVKLFRLEDDEGVVSVAIFPAEQGEIVREDQEA